MKPPFDIPADLDTPVSAFLKLAPFKPRFLLESVEGGERVARYSFLGFGDAVELTITGDVIDIDGTRTQLPAEPHGLMAALRDGLGQAPRFEGEDLPFRGGLVGFTGYDVVRRLERLPTRAAPLDEPEAAYVGTRSMLVFDHVTRRVAVLHDGSDAERAAIRREVIDVLRGPIPTTRGGASSSPTASLDRDAFIERVGRVKGHITDGDVFQLVLSVAFSGETELDPFQTYRALRLLNPSPYLYFVDAGGMQLVGGSPEALVKLDGRTATLRPIAGTRPRGHTPAEDLRLEAELLADPKEAAEHVMLVDLARNDLNRVAKPGSVVVEPYRSIERYSHVMHIVSGVTGELEPEHDSFDLFAASFPAGTVVGAPKVRAMELIDELEPERRGVYAGTVGYFGHGGAMDQAIAIRTVSFKDGRYRFQAGAGIVADSVPESEHAEVLAKSAAVVAALELAGEGL
jgi:anthranilate synthase component 1